MSRISDVLNQGWCGDTHTPNRGFNGDEFGVVDNSPFIVKVDDYPPVKSFPISLDCGYIYYMSYDTDENTVGPIPHIVWNNQWHTVQIFRESGAGYQLQLFPPEFSEVQTTPDFLMKFNGNEHDLAWDPILHPNWKWTDFVTNIQATTFEFQIEMLGANSLSFNQEEEYLVNIHGGSGNYGIFWSYRTSPGSNWLTLDTNQYALNYYTIDGSSYYFYDSEHKLNYQMGTTSIELRVEVKDNETSELLTAVKSITLLPTDISFINNIEENPNTGQLILDENKLDPINSGDSRSFQFGSEYHSIRTNELPFIVNWQSTGLTEKHIKWEFDIPSISSGMLNYNFQVTENTPSTMTSKFQSTESGYVRTLIDKCEVSDIGLNFKDPWHYYENGGNWYQHTDFLPYTSPIILENNTTNSYGGVFLNQGSPDWSPPYYSVQTITGQTINIGGVNRPLYFQNWSAYPIISAQFNNPNGLTTGVVFKDPGVTVQANYKGHMLSNNASASGSNGQRKLMRDQYGKYHLVYTSLNTLWYTKSTTTNFGGTWTQEVDLIQYGDAGEIKNPSIDITGDEIIVVYESRWVSDYTIEYMRWNVTNPYPGSSPQILTSIDGNYFGLAYPVVAYTSRPSDNTKAIQIVYRPSISGGLKYAIFYFNNGSWTEQGTGLAIPGTDFNSKNNTVTADKTVNKVYIAYSQEQRRINYCEFECRNNNGFEQTFTTPETISEGSGYKYNYSPSISIYGTLLNGSILYFHPIISWTGTDNTAGKLGDEQTAVIKKICVRPKAGSLWGNILLAGDNASVSQNSSSFNGGAETVIAWTQNNGSETRWIKRVGSSYNTTNCINPTGSGILLSSGTDLSSLKALTFSDVSLPYAFNKSDQNFLVPVMCASTPIRKLTSSDDILFGRSGLVIKNGVEFIFNIGDVVANNSVVEFKEMNDTIYYETTSELNEAVRTNTFILDTDADFIFSNLYYVNNSDFADTSLIAEDAVSFKAELVNATTGNVAGTFDEITFTKNNLNEYENIAYQVNCSGIQPGEYYLRLVTNVVGDAEYNLANVQTDASVIEKKSFHTVYFDGSQLPKEYDLSQNYPNPFNPTTVISWQSPIDSRQTIKVYDILGKEVVTLVDEFKAAGRYSVKFDGRGLASGVYIYQLRSGDFVASKKMLMIK